MKRLLYAMIQPQGQLQEAHIAGVNSEHFGKRLGQQDEVLQPVVFSPATLHSMGSEFGTINRHAK